MLGQEHGPGEELPPNGGLDRQEIIAFNLLKGQPIAGTESYLIRTDAYFEPETPIVADVLLDESVRLTDAVNKNTATRKATPNTTLLSLVFANGWELNLFEPILMADLADKMSFARLKKGIFRNFSCRSGLLLVDIEVIGRPVKLRSPDWSLDWKD